VLWCIKNLGKTAVHAQTGDVTRQRAQWCYLTIFPVIYTHGMQFQQNSHKVASMDHDGFSGVLIMLVSIVVSEKLPGQKRCDEEDDEY